MVKTMGKYGIPYKKQQFIYLLVLLLLLLKFFKVKKLVLSTLLIFCACKRAKAYFLAMFIFMFNSL